MTFYENNWKPQKLLITLKNTIPIWYWYNKLNNLKSNLEKQIKEIDTQTFDQNDELTIYLHDSSANCYYERVLKQLTYISALQKQVMDNKL